MGKKSPKVLINGQAFSVRQFTKTPDSYKKGVSAYMKSRRAAIQRAKQISQKNGPNSMEWVQSALFLFAAKKYGLEKDLKKAIWAYTMAMIERLEDYVSNAERISKMDNPVDAYHWMALQLRSAIRNHVKLLNMFKGDVIEVPPSTRSGKDICKITHRPTKNETFDAMTYMLQGFKQKNPDAAPFLPEKDEI